MLLCDVAVQKINEVFSTVNNEFEEFAYGMKVYRQMFSVLSFMTCKLVLIKLQRDSGDEIMPLYDT